MGTCGKRKGSCFANFRGKVGEIRDILTLRVRGDARDKVTAGSDQDNYPGSLHNHAKLPAISGLGTYIFAHE
jgi:hypothetical protein